MRYRVAVRYVDDRQRYHIEDLEAGSMADALRDIIDRVPGEVLQSADLIEIRTQVGDGAGSRYPSV